MGDWMKKNTSSKNSATKSTKSPAKSKTITLNLNDLETQKNIVKRKGAVVEKYINLSGKKSGRLRYFDLNAYRELYKRVDWLPKISNFEEVSDTVTKIEFEWIDGVLLDDLYHDKDNVMPSDMKSLHYYEVLNMYIEMLKFSKEKSPNLVFFHSDVSSQNLIKTPDERLVLIDPDKFQWGDRTNFITSIMSKYAKWLFKILETHETDK